MHLLCVCASQNMYVYVKKCECVFVCMSPSVDSSVCDCVCVSVFVFTAISRISSYEGWRAAQRRGKRLRKQMDSGLLSSCYLINAFNRERKSGPMPKSQSHNARTPRSLCIWTLSHPPYLSINLPFLHSAVSSPFKALYLHKY